jgi:hypothetical protein
LSNPSTIAQQQKLELFKSRFEAAGTALQTPGLVDKLWVQKNILRLTEDEIGKIRSGMKKDKIQELEIESTQITGAEGPSDLESPGGASSDIAQAIDLPGPEAGAALSENDSIQDENVPIKIQNKIDYVSSMLSEDEDKDDSQLTDDEKREKLRKDYEEKRRKRRRSQSSGRAEEFHRMSPRDEGDRRQNHDPSGMKREIDDLKSLSSLKMEDIDINDYLDSQIAHNAHMTDRLKNTLNNLDKSISKPKIYSGVISENNSSEGEK